MAGVATDDVSLDRVELVIKNTSVNLWWDGEFWVDSYARAQVNVSEGAWLYDVQLNSGDEYYMAVWAWDSSDNNNAPPPSLYLVTE